MWLNSRVTEQLNPHDDLIRQIAHDPNAQVMEDWELILASRPSPLLVELVADPTCLLRSLFLSALYIAFEDDPSS